MAGWADLQAGSPAGAMRAPHLLRWQNAFLKSWPLNFAALITKEKNVKTQTFGPGPWSQGSRPKSRALGGVGNKVTQPPTHPLASHACPLLAGVPPLAGSPTLCRLCPGSSRWDRLDQASSWSWPGGGEADGQTCANTLAGIRFQK